jgi:ribonuclease-3
VTPSTTSSPSSGRPDTALDPAGPHDPAGAVSAGPEAPSSEPLLARLGFAFDDRGLLDLALSHRSWCAEAGGVPSNERLEFLGDAVLGLVVAEHCYRTYPELPEGSLAKVRAAVVNTNVLAEVAADLELGRTVRLGRGEDASGGRQKASILANSVEAVIGAAYLDQGWDAAAALVLRLLGRRIADAAAGPGAEDFKTRLQELVIRRAGELPRYEVDGAGPDHARRYTASVYVGGRAAGLGEGRSKKDAEQAAAREAWQTLAAADAEGSETVAETGSPSGSRSGTGGGGEELGA